MRLLNRVNAEVPQPLAHDSQRNAHRTIWIGDEIHSQAVESPIHPFSAKSPQADTYKNPPNDFPHINRRPEAILSMMNEGGVAGYRQPPESNRPLLAPRSTITGMEPWIQFWEAVAFDGGEK